MPSAGPVQAHSIRGVATSVSFLRNWVVSKVLEAAPWKSNSVFAFFYLNDVSYVIEGLRSLGPFVAAGQVVAPFLLPYYWVNSCPISALVRNCEGFSFSSDEVALRDEWVAVVFYGVRFMLQQRGSFSVERLRYIFLGVGFVLFTSFIHPDLLPLVLVRG